MKDRLQQFLELKNITAARLADMLGIQRSAISHILGGRNKPGYDFIYKFLMTFPYVNAEWFITGKGEAIKNLSPLPQPAQKRIPEPLFQQKKQESMQNSVDLFDDLPYDNADGSHQNTNTQQVYNANNNNNSSGDSLGNGIGGAVNHSGGSATPNGNAASQDGNVVNRGGAAVSAVSATTPNSELHDGHIQLQRSRKVEKVILLFSDGSYQELL